MSLVATSANWLDAPHNRWGFRHVPELVDTRPIVRGAGPIRELPRSDRSLDGFAFRHDGRELDLPGFLAETYTDGLCVLAGGAVVAERYLDGMEPTDLHLLMSCSKSFTSVLVGVLADQGLAAPDDLVTDHVAELAGTTWEGCRLQDLLDMRPGCAWVDDVDEYLILDVSDYRTHDLHGQIPADTASWIATIAPGPHPHGEGPFRYCSLATDVLGWALERAAGASFPELFSREVWSRIGAESDAAIIVDHAGFPIVEGGICATLRDLARFGLACLDGRGVDGSTVVSSDWLKRPCRQHPELVEAYRASTAYDPATPDAFYHDCWWVHDGPRGIRAAVGMNGQQLLLHPETGVVVAKLSTFPAHLDPELFALQQAGLLALCEHLA